MPNPPKPRFDWFIYVSDLVSLAAAATATGTVTLEIAADAPFQVQFITLPVLQADKIVTDWGGTLTVNWTQEGRFLSNQALPIHAMALNGTAPYELKPYRLIPSNSSIVVQFNNNIATATDCRIAFHGNKVRM